MIAESGRQHGALQPLAEEYRPSVPWFAATIAAVGGILFGYIPHGGPVRACLRASPRMDCGAYRAKKGVTGTDTHNYTPT